MPILLRVDVDNAFIPASHSRLVRKLYLVLNYLNENYWVPKLKFIGYNKYVDVFINDLISLGVRASIFFKYTTVPVDRRIIDLLLRNDFDIGFHLLSAKTFGEFLKEKKAIERSIGKRVLGFTKHGDGQRKWTRKHAWRYEPSKYVEWGIRAGLVYFSGNEHRVYTKIEKKNNFYYLPHVFYIEPWARKLKTSIQEIIDYANSGYPVVALIHPWNYLLNSSARNDFNKIIDKADVIMTISDYLKVGFRIIT